MKKTGVPFKVVSQGPVPPGVIQEAKRFFKNSGGTPQIFIRNGRKKNTIYVAFIGAHEEETAMYVSEHYYKGRAAADTLLRSLVRGIDLFEGSPFHVRHKLSISHYITFTIIEEKWNTWSNRLIVGSIRGILHTNDVTFFDLTAKTAQFRGLYTCDSQNIPSTRFGARL